MYQECYQCGRIQNRHVCYDCSYAQLGVMDLYQRRLSARAWKLAAYPYPCDVHGMTQFHTMSGQCKLCQPPAPSRLGQDPARLQARHSGQSTYLGRCETHGDAHLWTANARPKCCYHQNGLKRAKPEAENVDTPRRIARRLGERKYNDVCEVHGRQLFWVLTGRCERCFLESGRPRVKQLD